MAIKEYVGKKSPVTVAVIAVFVVAVVAALFGGGVSGRAVSYTVVETEFPVVADFREGWGECNGLDPADWTDVDNFCRSKGFAGAVPSDARPCLHEWKPTRYEWDGALPMTPTVDRAEKNAGYALVAVRCSSVGAAALGA